MNNNHEHVTATDERVEKCIKEIINKIDRFWFKEGDEEAKFTIRNLLSSIHRKEWEQAVSHFLRFYDNVNDDERLVPCGPISNKSLVISTVLRYMSKHRFQFPLGKEDNFEDFIDLFIAIDDDDENDEDENRNADCQQQVKEILLLSIAIYQSNTCVDVINILINKKGRDFIINSKVVTGTNMLCLCLDSDNHSLDIVNRLIEAGGKELVMQKGGDGYTTLHYACKSSNPSFDVVNRLIEVGGEVLVMEKDIYGQETTLHCACQSDNPSVDIVNQLIEVGGRDLVMGKDKHYGFTALHCACKSSNPSIDIVNRLIEVGGRELVIEKSRYGDTTLHWACESENPSVDIVNRLIEVGGRDLVIRKDENGCTGTLLYAIESNNPSVDILNRLIEVGGRELVMEKDQYGSTSLHYVFLSFNPSVRRVKSKRPSMSSNPSIDVIKKLIKVGGKELVMGKDTNGKTPLSYAYQLKNPSIDVIKQLIEVGGRELVMEKDEGGSTTLHRECWSSNPSIDVIKKLIELGGRDLVMEKDNYGSNSLYCACQSAHPSIDIINCLIEVGGRELVIETTLYACISSNPSIDIVNRLIEVGGRELVMAKYVMEDGFRKTTLLWACQSENPSVDILNRLVEVGGRELLMIQADTNKRYHPLLLTFYDSIREVVIKTLIEEGLRLSLGGEFGIGGLFNCCTTTDDNGNTIDDHPRQIRFYQRGWNRYILPAFQNEELKALLDDQPILHAAIIAKAPPNIIQDIINHFPQSVTFQDSKGRHVIDVADEEGLKWNDGLKLIVEQLANQQGQTVMNVASYYGVEWDNGMEQVVEENQEQIGMVDDGTNLYPLMLAAVGDTTRNCDLSTIYNLIKRSSHLVKLYSTPIQISNGKESEKRPIQCDWVIIGDNIF